MRPIEGAPSPFPLARSPPPRSPPFRRAGLFHLMTPQSILLCSNDCNSSGLQPPSGPIASASECPPVRSCRTSLNWASRSDSASTMRKSAAMSKRRRELHRIANLRRRHSSRLLRSFTRDAPPALHPFLRRQRQMLLGSPGDHRHDATSHSTRCTSRSPTPCGRT